MDKQELDAIREKVSLFERNNFIEVDITIRLIKSVLSEIDRLQTEKDEIVESLIEIRHNRILWKSGGAGGQDQYAGLPPLCRIIDDLLKRLGSYYE